MTYYTDLFTGQNVEDMNFTYNTLSTLQVNDVITLFWPTDLIDSSNFFSNVLDLYVNHTGASLLLPDCTRVSPGIDSLFVNKGTQELSVFNFVSTTPITKLPIDSAVYIYLIDNSTPAGLWNIIPFTTTWDYGLSVLNINSLNDGIIITGSPVVGSGNTVTIGVNDALDQLGQFDPDSDAGIVTYNSTDGFKINNITNTDSNISLTNKDGQDTVLPSIDVDLNTSITVDNLTVTGDFTGEGNIVATDGYRGLNSVIHVSGYVTASGSPFYLAYNEWIDPAWGVAITPDPDNDRFIVDYTYPSGQTIDPTKPLIIKTNFCIFSNSFANPLTDATWVIRENSPPSGVDRYYVSGQSGSSTVIPSFIICTKMPAFVA